MAIFIGGGPAGGAVGISTPGGAADVRVGAAGTGDGEVRVGNMATDNPNKGGIVGPDIKDDKGVLKVDAKDDHY